MVILFSHTLHPLTSNSCLGLAMSSFAPSEFPDVVIKIEQEEEAWIPEHQEGQTSLPGIFPGEGLASLTPSVSRGTLQRVACC